MESNSFLNERNLFHKYYFLLALLSKRPIEPYVRAQVVLLYQSSLSVSKISKQLQVCWCYVRNATTKFDVKFDDTKRSGRLKNLFAGNVR